MPDTGYWRHQAMLGHLGQLPVVWAREGFDVVGADGFREAARMLESFEPDLVILDCPPSGWEGANACLRIRRAGPDASLLILTTGDCPATTSKLSVRRAGR